MIDPQAPDFASTPVAASRPVFGYAPASNEATPAISIVTPFFDTPPEIFAETLESVRRQSLQQWEWIIVDDGSRSPRCRAFLMESSSPDPRIRVLQQTNRGPAAARNAGVAEARAAYVLFLDSDDLLEPTAAEKWLWFLTSHPHFSFVKGFSLGFGAEEYLWSRGFHDRSAFLAENLVDATSLIRRDAFLAVGGHDETLSDGLEDSEFWLRCAAGGHWGGTVPEYLNWYRRRPDHGARWKNWDGGAREAELRRTWRHRYPHLWKRGFPQPKEATRPAADVELEAPSFRNELAKDRPRLLLVVPWTAMGGADRFNLDLVGQLKRHGWETTIVTTLHGDHSWLPQFSRLTPDVFPASHFLAPADYPRFLRYLIGSRRPDVILVTHSVFAYEALPYLRRIAGEIPIVDYCHCTEPWLGGGYPRLSVDRRELLDLQIVSSKALKEWMVAQGADQQRIEVCHTNYDIQEAEELPTRDQLGLPDDVSIITYPCRMTDQKQPPVFAKTMLELRRRGHRFVALAVGDGPYLPWLKRFARRKGLARHVRFLGVQSNARTRALIARSDCVFIPSTHEGISLAFYEALAAGVPVVGADVGGQRELVTPDCGVLVQRADPDTEVERYADALEDLLRDSDRRRAMGAAGQTRVRTHFRLDEMGERMHALLRRVGELAVTSPRVVPNADAARRSAIAAVRGVKLAAPSADTWLGTRSPHLRDSLFKALSRIGMPLYGFGMKMGMHWLERLKDRIFEALYPRAE